MQSVRRLALLVCATMALGAAFASGASAASLNAYVDVDPDPSYIDTCFSYPFSADRPGNTQVSPTDIGQLECGNTVPLEFTDDIVIDFQTDGTGSVSPSSSGSFGVSFAPGLGSLGCEITVSAPVPIEEVPGGILGESWLGSIEVDNTSGDATDNSGFSCPAQPYDLKIGFFVDD